MQKIDRRVFSIASAGVLMLLLGALNHKLEFTVSNLNKIAHDPLMVLGAGFFLTPLMTWILHYPLRYTDVPRLATPVLDGGILRVTAYKLSCKNDFFTVGIVQGGFEAFAFDAQF